MFEAHQFAQINAKLDQILQENKTIMLDISALQSAVANETTVENSAMTLLLGIANELKAISANSTDAATQSAINTLVTQMTNSQTNLAASVATNTVTAGSILVITPVSIPPASVNTAYGPVNISASGGVAPITFAATGLPAGMTLTPAGVLSGSVAAAGTFTIVVTATDANGIVSAPLSLTLTVS
jgi:hypothetical protein